MREKANPSLAKFRQPKAKKIERERERESDLEKIKLREKERIR